MLYGTFVPQTTLLSIKITQNIFLASDMTGNISGNSQKSWNFVFLMFSRYTACGCVSFCHNLELYQSRFNGSSSFLAESTLNSSYTVLKGNLGMSKIRVLPSGTLCQILDL